MQRNTVPPYGKQNRPSTPMRAVMSNFYGELGAYHHDEREKEIQTIEMTDNDRLKNPPRCPTRASFFADNYIRESKTQAGFA